MSSHARVRTWVTWWVLGSALWLLLDDTVALPELVDGAIVAALGATAATLAAPAAPAGRRLAPELRAADFARPLWRLVADLPSLLRVLWRALAHGERAPGELTELPFAIADPEAPGVDEARIALATYAGSLAPGTVVVGIDPKRSRIIVHGLSGPPTRDAADPLGLG